jgi:hypothetical protein
MRPCRALPHPGHATSPRVADLTLMLRVVRNGPELHAVFVPCRVVRR